MKHYVNSLKYTVAILAYVLESVSVIVLTNKEVTLHVTER